jgi:cell fate regulator YaaT (PSP1 superfamily)
MELPPEDVCRQILEGTNQQAPNVLKNLIESKKVADEKYHTRIEEMKRECKIIMATCSRLEKMDFDSEDFKEDFEAVLKIVAKQSLDVMLMAMNYPLPKNAQLEIQEVKTKPIDQE